MRTSLTPIMFFLLHSFYSPAAAGQDVQASLQDEATIYGKHLKCFNESVNQANQRNIDFEELEITLYREGSVENGTAKYSVLFDPIGEPSNQKSRKQGLAVFEVVLNSKCEVVDSYRPK
ncbi:MAG: hypothetical protein AAF530_23755 [Pseudomonadota bacterium]